MCEVRCSRTVPPPDSLLTAKSHCYKRALGTTHTLLTKSRRLGRSLPTTQRNQDWFLPFVHILLCIAGSSWPHFVPQLLLDHRPHWLHSARCHWSKQRTLWSFHIYSLSGEKSYKSWTNRSYQMLFFCLGCRSGADLTLNLYSYSPRRIYINV